ACARCCASRAARDANISMKRTRCVYGSRFLFSIGSAQAEMHPLREKTAIVGAGASPQGKLPGSTSLSLAVEAFKRALDDSGLKKEHIDGLLSMPGTTAPEGAYNFARLGEALGIDPLYTGSMIMGGNTAGALLHMA